MPPAVHLQHALSSRRYASRGAPLYRPVQAFVALGETPGWWEQEGQAYPMDYYASDGGAWNSSWHKKRAGGGGGGLAAARAALAHRAAAAPS